MLLVQTVSQYGGTTLFTLADGSELMDFMGQTACGTKLNSIWKGRMALYTSTMKVCTYLYIVIVNISYLYNVIVSISRNENLFLFYTL